MANLQEVVSWDAGVYQLETSDPVLGGPGGTSNKQAQALANRTAYLKKHMDDLEGGTTAAGKANKLTTARTIAVAGDVTGQASFDGSGNISITATYKNSGVVAGTYRSVTVDAKGNVTAGSNPTTLSGYGITDALPATGTAAAAQKLATARTIALAGDITGQANFDGSGNISITATYKNSGVAAGTYRSVTVDAKGNITAGTNPTTLVGYGITDAVSSTQYATEATKGIAAAATQAEVDAGTDDSKFVTALKLMNWVKQAGESVLGMLKVATQAQTNAGAADDVAVTPKKLRAGFAASFATAGYLAFPTWMGGLIIQWGSIFVPANSTATGSLPIAFPTAAFQGVCTYDSPVGSIYPTAAMNFPSLSTYQIGVKSAAGTNFIMRYIAIGY
ncbi:gp53-like domain-containing protein [Aeromonas caviae]|uniref:gp53-like domain-containing protein n=1 Tax=Aeromonas caviae TaxID=648 RepID=UPI002B45BEA0|nr:phage tail protein [Aeromonas caviae]